MLWAAYFAALVIGVAAFRSDHRLARGAALLVGVLAAATGTGLAIDARAEGHALDELGLTLLLAASGLLLAVGAAVWLGSAAHALRLAGFVLTIAVLVVPSTLTLALPIAALAAPALHQISAQRVSRPQGHG